MSIHIKEGILPKELYAQLDKLSTEDMEEVRKYLTRQIRWRIGRETLDEVVPELLDKALALTASLGTVDSLNPDIRFFLNGVPTDEYWRAPSDIPYEMAETDPALQQVLAELRAKTGMQVKLQSCKGTFGTSGRGLPREVNSCEILVQLTDEQRAAWAAARAKKKAESRPKRPPVSPEQAARNKMFLTRAIPRVLQKQQETD